jgi:hypothetical protein
MVLPSAPPLPKQFENSTPPRTEKFEYFGTNNNYRHHRTFDCNECMSDVCSSVGKVIYICVAGLVALVLAILLIAPAVLTEIAIGVVNGARLIGTSIHKATPSAMEHPGHCIALFGTLIVGCLSVAAAALTFIVDVVIFGVFISPSMFMIGFVTERGSFGAATEAVARLWQLQWAMSGGDILRMFLLPAECFCCLPWIFCPRNIDCKISCNPCGCCRCDIEKCCNVCCC